MTTGWAIFIIGGAALVLAVIIGGLGFWFMVRQHRRFDDEWQRASRRFDEWRP